MKHTLKSHTASVYKVCMCQASRVSSTIGSYLHGPKESDVVSGQCLSFIIEAHAKSVTRIVLDCQRILLLTLRFCCHCLKNKCMDQPIMLVSSSCQISKSISAQCTVNGLSSCRVYNVPVPYSDSPLLARPVPSWTPLPQPEPEDCRFVFRSSSIQIYFIFIFSWEM